MSSPLAAADATLAAVITAAFAVVFVTIVAAVARAASDLVAAAPVVSAALFDRYEKAVGEDEEDLNLLVVMVWLEDVAQAVLVSRKLPPDVVGVVHDSNWMFELRFSDGCEGSFDVHADLLARDDIPKTTPRLNPITKEHEERSVYPKIIAWTAVAGELNWGGCYFKTESIPHEAKSGGWDMEWIRNQPINAKGDLAPRQMMTRLLCGWK
jgi:hypothetical protein